MDDEQPLGDATGTTEPLNDLAEDNEKLMKGEPVDRADDRQERGRSVDLQALREIMYSLHAVSIGTHQVLYFSAMKYCKNHMDVDASTIQEAADDLAQIFDRMNLGTLRLKEKQHDEHQDRILFELEENAVAFDADTDKPVCYFLSGYIAGYLENALDEHFVVNEIACTSQGNDVCLFRAQRR